MYSFNIYIYSLLRAARPQPSYTFRLNCFTIISVSKYHRKHDAVRVVAATPPPRSRHLRCTFRCRSTSMLAESDRCYCCLTNDCRRWVTTIRHRRRRRRFSSRSHSTWQWWLLSVWMWRSSTSCWRLVGTMAWHSIEVVHSFRTAQQQPSRMWRGEAWPMNRWRIGPSWFFPVEVRG